MGGAVAYNGSLGIVILLLDRASDVNLTGRRYGTTLISAAYNCSLQVTTLLLGRGADVNVPGGCGTGPR
ncbi:hypothetical protein L211DRAFT_789347 [Terfezia boudieri ATCC MYA-4762]|uniref:Uncharacterized protein n=1 Tax=Terfezia boudieri ATCC MYA-4762 TaxID=1051890 RepID=A0A3N4LGR5_9PEZI|nr:hypothetical protein L211DRAFT_789347 [Terfezia boudieri ATCC MYA-4762]